MKKTIKNKAGHKSYNARVAAVCISEKKGTSKRNVHSAEAIKGYGLKDDAHAGKWHRQVSLLALEDIEVMRRKGLDLHPGDFAENITTKGIKLESLAIGTKLKIGNEVTLKVSQIGKVCPHPCAIFYKIGHCIMPKKGIFTEVVKGGTIRTGDVIKVLRGKSRERNKEKKCSRQA